MNVMQLKQQEAQETKHYWICSYINSCITSEN